MKVLIVQIIGSYIDADVELVLNKMGHHTEWLDAKKFRGNDLYVNDALERLLEEKIVKRKYDAVYSANFFPLLANRCHETDMVYLAWHYDTPPHLPTMQHMDYPTNHIFFFNRKDYEYYAGKGLESVHFLPLAVNTKRLTALKQDRRFDTQISFVGQLYQSTLPALRNNMNSYDSGWVDGLIQAQRQVYGEYFIPDLITEERLDSISKNLLEKKMISESLDPRQLAYSMATYLTYLDRVSLLSLLSERYQTDLYSERFDGTEKELLEKVRYRGTVDYGTQMPLVFRQSKINLCPILRSNEHAIPLRALDVMGSGGLLMANYQSGLAEFFENGKELIMYADIQEAVMQVEYLLSHEEERVKIAQRGFERMENDFGYEDRIRKMLKVSGLSA